MACGLDFFLVNVYGMILRAVQRVMTVDGYSYVRLVENELPEIRKLAEERQEVDIVKQIDDLMRFIELGVNGVDGDVVLLVFDGM